MEMRDETHEKGSIPKKMHLGLYCLHGSVNAKTGTRKHFYLLPY